MNLLHSRKMNNVLVKVPPGSTYTYIIMSKSRRGKKCNMLSYHRKCVGLDVWAWPVRNGPVSTSPVRTRDGGTRAAPVIVQQARCSVKSLTQREERVGLLVQWSMIPLIWILSMPSIPKNAAVPLLELFSNFLYVRCHLPSQLRGTWEEIVLINR
jgi:hypothetical protein